MARRPEVAVIACWWGPFPSNFPVTLKTMAVNSDVRWILFTGNDPGPLPDNVELHRVEFSEFASRVQSHFEFKIALDTPYKICDFRPAFGEVLDREIDDADYWGHCDLDVLFGRVTHLLRVPLDAQYDKILVRGSFALYKNDRDVNAWYKTVSGDVDYRAVFADPSARYFDEWAGIYKIIRHRGESVWLSDDVVFDIAHYRYWPRAQHGAGVFPIYYWDNGRLYEGHLSTAQRREGVAIHFQKRVMARPSYEVLSSDRFYVAPRGFSTSRPTVLSEIGGAPAFYAKRLVRRLAPGQR